MVVLTSFKKAEEVMKELGLEEDRVFSVARFQPRGYSFKTIDFLVPTDAEGKPLKLSEMKPKDYKEAYRKKLKSHIKEVNRWLESLEENEDILLLCWCPHSKHSSKELEDKGVFYCHTGLIGRLINHRRPDITVVLDEERDEGLAQEWKPERYKRLSSVARVSPETVIGFMLDYIWNKTRKRPSLRLYENGQGFMEYEGEVLPFRLYTFSRGEVLKKARVLVEDIEAIDSGEFLPF